VAGPSSEGPATFLKVSQERFEDQGMLRRFSFKNQRGQTMAEFALVLPMLALLLFAVTQFGITFNRYLALTDAVRAGARAAAVSRHAEDPAGTAEARVREAAANLDQADLSVTVTSSWETGDDVVVSASYPYSINLLGVVVASGDLTSQTTERVE
jgi:Flp pilus assembly protein TadG